MTGRGITVAIIATLAIALPSLAQGAGGAGEVRASGATIQKALDYLRTRQQDDGGFAEPDKDSSDQLTAWVVVSIAAAGEDPGSWTRSGKSPLDFLASRAPGWNNLTDIERACLAVSSAGGDPRQFGGRNLVAEITARIGGDGHIGDMVNDHFWGMIALAAAGETVPEQCRAWLSSTQKTDGGFSFSQDSESDPDDTGAALQALASTGESAEGSVVTRALAFLRFCQESDGGFCWQSVSSNTASTAWAVQGIAAAGQDPDSSSWSKEGMTPVDYLEDMQQSDGHIRYMENSDAQPAWMTSESIPALLLRPYPLNFDPGPGETTSPSSDTGEAVTTTGQDDGGTVPDGGKLQAESSGRSTSGELPSGNQGADPSRKEQGQDGTGSGLARAGSAGTVGSGTGRSSGFYLFLIICAGYLVVLGGICLALRLS